MRSHGFTLIELMMVVVIIGILAAIAFPSYSRYVLRGNRTVGKTVLLEIASRQESYFSDRKRYAEVLGPPTATWNLGYSANPVYVTRDGRTQSATSSDAIYSVTLAAYTAASVADCSAGGTPTATAFAVVATPINAQAKDTQCGKICLGSPGDKGASGSNSASCWRS